MTNYTSADALTALQCLDSGCDRSRWVRILMAAKAAGVPEDDAIAWSAAAANFSGERDVSSVWRGIRTWGGIGPGTLFGMAQDAGWSRARPISKLQSVQRLMQPETAPPKPASPRRSPSASDVWRRCLPATAAHAYIASKGGLPNDLRVVPEDDTLRIAGDSVAGWLAVPVFPLAGGEPVSIQFIPPPGIGKKLNFPGASMTGVFIVGDMPAAGTAYVCEGIGQAWACWRAAGHAAVVCFGAGRMLAVAKELRERDASMRLVVVADAGKETDAEAIASEVAGAYVRMPLGSPPNFDACDLAQRDGTDALEALLADAIEPPRPEPRFKLRRSAELRDMPPPSWRVRGVLPAQGVASVFGQSASGKSFLALDLAAAVAEGRDWFGYRVTPSPVVYVCLEGAAGFRMRVAAWEAANGRPLPEGLRFVLQPFKLTEPKDVDDLATAVLTAGAAAVIVLDTLNASAPGIDENASRDMGIVIEAAKTLQSITAGLVTAVHHSGKDATKGLRGHSSLFAALDAAIEVTREGDRRDWKVAKAKDGQDGAAHSFRLEVVGLGQDEDGEPVSSCVVRPNETPHSATRSRQPKGGNQRIAYDALGELLRKSSAFGMAGAPPLRPCVEIEAAVAAIAPRLMCEPPRQKERTRQALTGLLTGGVVTSREGWIWLP